MYWLALYKSKCHHLTKNLKKTTMRSKPKCHYVTKKNKKCKCQHQLLTCSCRLRAMANSTMVSSSASGGISTIGGKLGSKPHSPSRLWIPLAWPAPPSSSRLLSCITKQIQLYSVWTGYLEIFSVILSQMVKTSLSSTSHLDPFAVKFTRKWTIKNQVISSQPLTTYSPLPHTVHQVLAPDPAPEVEWQPHLAGEDGTVTQEVCLPCLLCHLHCHHQLLLLLLVLDWVQIECKHGF